MRACVRGMVAVAVMMLGSVPATQAWDGSAKADHQGPVSVTVAPMAEPGARGAVRIKVALDSHSVDLGRVAFEDIVVIRTAAGADIKPTSVDDTAGGGHHRQAVLVFPAVDGTPLLRVVVKEVGGVAERVFAWQ